MKKLSYFLIPALIICSVSCKKHSSSATSYDYMIFGLYYGECGGKCAKFYQLKDGQLKQDTTITSGDIFGKEEFGVTDSLNRPTPNFKFDNLLPNDKYALVQDLPTDLPAQLYNENRQVYGHPDDADQGAMDVYISLNNKVYKWTFDTYKQNDPAYQTAFIDRLEKAFQQLQ